VPAITTAPALPPTQVHSAVDEAAVLASHCPSVRRSSMFPTTADKVADILKPAADYIRQQTGNEVLDKNDTAQEMVAIVRANLLDLKLLQHKGKAAKSVGGKI
jgi:hypothetical protein